MTSSRAVLADAADRFGAFLKQHGLALETFAAHLRLDILTPREAWALRRFARISGGSTAVTDLRNKLFFQDEATITPRTATASVTGTSFDAGTLDGPMFGLLMVGAVSGTGPTLDVAYTESETSGGAYTTIPRATHPQVVASSQCSWARIMRSKRWVRGVATIGGGSPSFALAVQIFGQLKRI